MYNQGGSSSNFVSVIGESPPNLSLTVTKSGLNTNVVYVFKYRVQNKFGWSNGYSPTVEVRSATFPSKVTTVQFQIIEQTRVRISWLPPYDGGSPITAYTILLGDSQETMEFFEVTAYCDGSTYTTLTNRFCDLPMSAFRDTPLNLKFKDLIVAKVAATNLIGQGDYSDPNEVGLIV